MQELKGQRTWHLKPQGSRRSKVLRWKEGGRKNRAESLGRKLGSLSLPPAPLRARSCTSLTHSQSPLEVPAFRTHSSSRPSTLSPAPGGPQLLALFIDKSTAPRAILQYQPAILTESMLSAQPLEWLLPLNFLLPLVRGDSAGRLATWSGAQQSFRDRSGQENEH